VSKSLPESVLCQIIILQDYAISYAALNEAESYLHVKRCKRLKHLSVYRQSKGARTVKADKNRKQQNGGTSAALELQTL